jgi:predicted RNA binding protein YcfA (HicA-like mRNA interferase family)
MTKKQKLLANILCGSKNIRFDEFATLVEAFGFQLARINGSHHIFQHPAISEQLNLQNKNGQAKPYQIKQFLRLVEEYNLTMGNEPPQK